MPLVANVRLVHWSALIATAAVVAACAGSSPPSYQVGGQDVQGYDAAGRLMAEAGILSAAQQLPQVEAPPKVLFSVPPIPPSSVEAGVTRGEVRIEISVDERGQIGAIKVLTTPSPVLTEAVLTAVRQWRFSPMIHAGKPEAFVAKQTFNFQP